MFQNSRSYLGEVLGGVFHGLAEVWGGLGEFVGRLGAKWGCLGASGRVEGSQGGHGDIDPVAAVLRSNAP
jgi:hypothetical protein